MLARLPWTPPAAAAKPTPARINKDRRAHIMRVVIAVLAQAEPTPFAFEATCRHAIRSRLCLRGWKWAKADDMAAEIVRDSLYRIGAKRPTWEEGQPEYMQLGAGSQIERVRCVRCHKPLPEGHWKFCSALCATNHSFAQRRVQTADESEVYDIVVRRLPFWQNVDATG